jgi:death-on-curing protein
MEHGGLPGFRDEGLFALAVARPWMTAFGEELYKTPFQKAAAIADSIVHNHVFNDGNHRTALAAAYIILGLNSLALVGSDEDKGRAILDLEGGRMTLDEFAVWLERNSVFRSVPSAPQSDASGLVSKPFAARNPISQDGILIHRRSMNVVLRDPGSARSHRRFATSRHNCPHFARS